MVGIRKRHFYHTPNTGRHTLLRIVLLLLNIVAPSSTRELIDHQVSSVTASSQLLRAVNQCLRQCLYSKDPSQSAQPRRRRSRHSRRPQGLQLSAPTCTRLDQGRVASSSRRSSPRSAVRRATWAS